MKLGDKVMNKLTGRQMETRDVDLNQMVNLLCRLFIAQTTTDQEADQVYTTVKGGLIREKKLLSKDERFEITCYTGRKTGPFNVNDRNVIWIHDTKYDKYYEYRSFSFKKLKTIIKCNVQQKKTSGASGMESGCMNIPYPEAEINLQQFQGEKYKDRNWVPILWGGAIAFVVLILAVAFLTSGDSQEDSAAAETESQIEEIDSDGEEEELASAAAESGENSADEVMAAYKAECQDFDYREYFRYEQEHLGEKIKLEMQVEQVIDGDFRGYDAQGNEYYIFDEREEESPFRVMEGDVLTVYGEYSGVVELTRALGDYESEVFSITARYADLMGEESEVEGAYYSGLSSYIGTWDDQYSQRCNMEITSLSESEVSVLIRWSSSATEESQWTMTGVYQPDSGTLEYTDGVLTNNVYQDNGDIFSEEAYSGGTGRFYIEDGYLYWVDDVENQGAECYFQRTGEVASDNQTVENTLQRERVSVASYTGPFPINSIINTAFSCFPDDLTESNMEITQNPDGSLHLSIQASSLHNPYVDNFSGDSVQITATEMADLYILFASDGTDPNDSGDDVTVVWSSAEAIDFPTVEGWDGNITYLYNGQYSYSGVVGENVQTNASTYQTMYVVNCNESITLRTSPSTQAAEICQIPLGAAVSFISGAENGFYEISYLGNTGYALASYLSYEQPLQQQTTYQTMRVVNCNESITLRTSPSTQAAEICQIPLGAVVSYIEPAANGFYRVTYLGQTGYVLASYLEFV